VPLADFPDDGPTGPATDGWVPRPRVGSSSGSGPRPDLRCACPVPHAQNVPGSGARVLVGKVASGEQRVGTILLAAVGRARGGGAVTAAGAGCGFWEWPPQPWSPFGIGCGVVGGAIVLFEMAILPRKWLRGRRLGPTAVWMRLHIWLGLCSLPIVL